MANPNIRPVGVETSIYRHFLLCAGPGFGKTVFFGTGNERVLFLTTDKEGTLSAAMMGSTSKEWPINNGKDMNDAFKYLRDGGLAKEGLDAPNSWVVIDNISEAEEQFKWDNIAIDHKRSPDKIDEFVPTQANYQRTQNQLLMMTKQFLDLPVNVGFTAWIERLEDSEGDEYFAPAIHGQKGSIAQMIAGYMNVVGYGEVLLGENDEEHRRIHFAQNGPFRGKDRYQALGKYRTDMTLPKMDELINKKLASVKGGSKTPARSARPATKAPVRRATTPRKKGA